MSEWPSDINEYPPSKAYRFLEPGPVILITTQPQVETEGKGPAPRSPKRRKLRSTSGSKASLPSPSREAADVQEDEGEPSASHETVDPPELPHANIMTCGFHMPMQHSSPPLLSVIIGPWDTTYRTLQDTHECVVAVPSVSLTEKVVDIGNCSSTDVDKFAKFALTPLRHNATPQTKSRTRKAPGKTPKVSPPLVREALANFLCVVHDTAMVKKYNMWILRVVKAWVREPAEGEDTRIFHHRGDGTFVVDGETINLQERMVLWKEYQD